MVNYLEQSEHKLVFKELLDRKARLCPWKAQILKVVCLNALPLVLHLLLCFRFNPSKSTKLKFSFFPSESFKKSFPLFLFLRTVYSEQWTKTKQNKECVLTFEVPIVLFLNFCLGKSSKGWPITLNPTLVRCKKQTEQWE